MLIYRKDVKAGLDLETRTCFGDIAQTIPDIFGISEKLQGESFRDDVKEK